MGCVEGEGMNIDREAARAARDQLASTRWRFALIGVAGIAAGVGGLLWTGQLRWLALAVMGLGALLSVIPVQMVVRQVDTRNPPVPPVAGDSLRDGRRVGSRRTPESN